MNISFSTTEVHLFFLGRCIYIYIKEVSFLYLFCSSYVPLHLYWSVHAGMFQYSCALVFVPSRVSFPVCVIHWLCLCASLYFLSVSPVYAVCSYLGLCMYVSPCFYCLRVGGFFDGVGGGEIVCHFALYLSFNVFPMFA